MAATNPSVDYPLPNPVFNSPVLDIQRFLDYCLEHGSVPPRNEDARDLCSKWYPAGVPTHVMRMQIRKQVVDELYSQPTENGWLVWHSIQFWSLVFYKVSTNDHSDFRPEYRHLLPDIYGTIKARRHADRSERQGSKQRLIESGVLDRRHDPALKMCREWVRLNGWNRPKIIDGVSVHGPTVRGGYCAECLGDCDCKAPNDVGCTHFCHEGCASGMCKDIDHVMCVVCHSQKKAAAYRDKRNTKRAVYTVCASCPKPSSH